MDAQQTRNILEACLLVAGKAMTIAQLENLFETDIDRPDRNEIKAAMADLQSQYEGRGIELVEVASGWRLQSSSSMEHWVGRLFQDKTPRYSRALLETLVLIAYRQPITRGEIEEVRGVAVSTNIIKTLQERDWVKEVGYKDVPGKPALWGTTRQFLDYFNLKRLDELPTLAEARELEEIDAALAAEMGLVDGVTDSVAANDSSSSEGDESVEAEQAETESTDVLATEKTAASDTVEAEGAEVSNVDAEENNDLTAKEVPDEEPSDLLSSDVRIAGDEQEVNAAVKNADADESMEIGANSEEQLATLADNLPGADAPPVSSAFSALVSNFIQGEQKGDLTDVDSVAESAVPIDQDIVSSEAEAGSELEGADEAGKEIPSREPREISAHDVVTEEWKEPVPNPVPDQGQVPTSEIDWATDSGSSDFPSPPSIVSDESSADIDSISDESSGPSDSESELRRVIDDFAEEHQKELDARDEFESRTLNGGGREEDAPAVADSIVEPEGDLTDFRRIKKASLYGVSGSVDSELEVLEDMDVEATVDPPEGKSAEP